MPNGALLVRQAVKTIPDEFEPASFGIPRLQLLEGRSGRRRRHKFLGKSANAAYIAKCRVKRRLREILQGRFEIWDAGVSSKPLIVREPDHECRRR